MLLPKQKGLLMITKRSKEMKIDKKRIKKRIHKETRNLQIKIQEPVYKTKIKHQTRKTLTRLHYFKKS